MLFKGLLLSFFLDYVRPAGYLSILNVFKLNALVPLSVLAFTLFQNKSPISNNQFLKHPNTKWFFFFMFLLFAALFTAEVTLYAYKTFNLVLGFLIWYFLIIKLILSIEQMKKMFIVIVFSHIALLFLNPQVILNPETRSYIDNHSFLGDGNDFALSVCIAIPMCIFLIMDSEKFLHKALYITAIMILFLAIIGTQSRGATIALAVVFLYLWWMGKQKMIGIVLAVIAVIAVLIYAPPVYFERMNTLKNYEEEGSAMGRIIAWKTAIRMATTYPLTGVSTGHFTVALGTEFRPPEFGSENLPWLTAHSMYFLILGELAFPGILFLLAMLITNYFRANRFYKLARGSPGPEMVRYAKLFLMLNASLVGFAVAGAFLSVAYYPHLYVLAALLVSAQHMLEKELSDKKKAV